MAVSNLSSPSFNDQRGNEGGGDCNPSACGTLLCNLSIVLVASVSVNKEDNAHGHKKGFFLQGIAPEYPGTRSRIETKKEEDKNGDPSLNHSACFQKTQKSILLFVGLQSDKEGRSALVWTVTRTTRVVSWI